MKIFDKFFGYDKQMNKVKTGKGVKKKKISDKEKYSLKSFFVIYKEKFWKLSILNMIFVLLCLPVLCAVLAYTGIFDTQAAGHSNPLYPVLYGTYLHSPNPALSDIMGIYGTRVYNYFQNNTTYLFYGLGLIAALTFGPANTGMTYVLRAFTRGDYVYIWHDFFGAIKKNFFSSILMGICDLLIMFLLVFSAIYYYSAGTVFTNSMLFFAVIFISVIYFMMRFYMYLLLITFKLKPIKLIKNALIFTLIGIKRNVAAILGILILAGLNVLLFMFLPNFGLLLPFLMIISNCSFMCCFAAYYSLKKYIIDPYYEEHPEENPEEVHGEPIFIDRG